MGCCAGAKEKETSKDDARRQLTALSPSPSRSSPKPLPGTPAAALVLDAQMAAIDAQVERAWPSDLEHAEHPIMTPRTPQGGISILVPPLGAPWINPVTALNLPCNCLCAVCGLRACYCDSNYVLSSGTSLRMLLCARP